MRAAKQPEATTEPFPRHGGFPTQGQIDNDQQLRALLHDLASSQLDEKNFVPYVRDNYAKVLRSLSVIVERGAHNHRRGLRQLLLPVILAVFAAACGSHAEVPDGLLSQDSVGGVEHVHVIDNDADDDADDSQDLHAATQCGPELLWGFPFRDGDFVKYERADSTVTIGVAPPNGSHFDNITRIRMRIKTEQCQDGKLFAAGDEGESRVATRWNVNELDGFARTSIAFKADVSNNLEFNDDPDAPANIHRYRAYQLVDPDDTKQGPLVMVWIETHGDHKPEVGELKRLLGAQTELTGGRDD